jgi:hypothetical protein
MGSSLQGISTFGDENLLFLAVLFLMKPSDPLLVVFRKWYIAGSSFL